MGRPKGRYTFPVASFDTHLALLQHKLNRLDVPFGGDEANQLFPKEEDYFNVAHQFITNAIARHPLKDDRMEVSRPFLEKCFGGTLETEYDYEDAWMGRNESEGHGIEGNATIAEFYGYGAFTTEVKQDPASPKPWITRCIVEANTVEGNSDLLIKLTEDYAKEAFLFKARMRYTSFIVS